MGTTNIFCLPYAGGSATVLTDALTQKLNSSNYTAVPLELPGRGMRFGEECVLSTEDLFQAIEPLLSESTGQDESYYLLGHSMGGELLPHLYHKIIERGGTPPKGLIICGAEPPEHLTLAETDEASLLKEMKKGGATSEEFFESPELVELFLPIVQADYLLLNSLVSQIPKQMDCELIIINGEDDAEALEHHEDWRNYTTAECRFFQVAGGHFFITENTETAAIINQHI
ncbi:thioesterase II family protein [Enterococcus larvae]|uniref:thioesterase II family protein n=1 Tax=Enterococcus larvae TaxID=2794352 RepID=UPI003F302B7C